METNNNTPTASDLLHASTSLLFRDTLLSELHHTKALIEHRQNQLNVYTNSKELIDMQLDGDDDCLVFLSDNFFVMRKNQLAKAFLQRQIHFFTSELLKLEQETKALELKLCDHKQKNSSDGSFDSDKMAEEVKAKPEQKNVTKPPKGVTEKDYTDFLKLLDRMNVSDEESSEEDMENGGGKETSKGRNTDVKKRVQFVRGPGTQSVANKKSILRNRNERSPINAEELQKMWRREFVEYQTTPKEILSDFVLERGADINRETKKAVGRRKTKKERTFSTWKTRKMGVPNSE